MAEGNILSLLCQSVNINKNESTKYNKHYLKEISKTLTQLVYENKLNKKEVKIEYIQLIQYFCRLHQDPLALNETNLNTVLNYLNICKRGSVVDEHITTIKNSLDFNSSDLRKSLKSEINLFVAALYKKKESDNHNKDMIVSYDQKQFSNFDFQFINKEIKRPFLYNIEITDDENLSTNRYSLCNTVDRESLIKLGYGIINLNHTSAKDVLENVIYKISYCGTINAFEITFFKYLWFHNNFGSLRYLITEKFSCVIEIPLIRIATKLLEENIDISYLDHDEEFQKITQITQSNNVIKYKVLNVIYQLFILSGYNNMLLKLVKVVK